MFSDHVYAYVDSTEAKLFQGLINCPVPLHSRESRISQKDKKKIFQQVLIENIKQNQTKEKVFALARKFLEEGRTKENKERYQVLDTQFTQAALAAAKKSGEEKIWLYSEL